MPEAEPVLLRRLGAGVTVAALLAGALLVGLRQSPARGGERMVLLTTRPGTVQTQAAQPAPGAHLRRWTPAVGAQIARRATRWLGWPYSFAGGNADGPTYGTPVDADSRNDGHVIGFDCSGLTLFALAPWRALPHDAARQYTAAGSFHPRLDQLQPGDLIFWSPDGTVDAIGHVAVYLGGGRVVQAPRSGQRITVSPLYGVERAYMGATRPLT